MVKTQEGPLLPCHCHLPMTPIRCGDIPVMGCTNVKGALMDTIVSALGAGFHFLFYFVFAYLLVLATVIFIHELGHFLVGRLFRMRISTFAIGFGPEIFGFNDRHGTRWKLAAIPLGGYVKFFGDADGSSRKDGEAERKMSDAEKVDCFHFRPVWQRMLVVAAGPLANFILAIGIFAAMFTISGRSYILPVAEEIKQGSAAEKAGFQPGDRILSINGRPIRSYEEFMPIIQVNAGTTLRIGIERAGAPMEITATPDRVEEKTAFGKLSFGQIGIMFNGRPEFRRLEQLSLPSAVVAGVEECGAVLRQTFTFLGRLFTGRENLDQMNGPIGIANITGHVAQVGFDNLIRLMAVLSFSIGLVNLFPIPILDGGHLVFYMLEALRRRPLPERAQEFGYRIGFGLIMALLVVISFNDVRKLIEVFVG
jgi:regulator of sigma E protease